MLKQQMREKSPPASISGSTEFTFTERLTQIKDITEKMGKDLVDVS